MTELQNNEQIEEPKQVENNEQIEDKSALATEEKPVEKQEEQISEGAQKAINKEHFKRREQERKADDLAIKLAEAERKLSLKPEKGIQAVPELPDSFDDDFKERLAERDRIITENAQVTALKSANEQQTQLNQQEQQRNFVNSLQGKVDTYSAKAKELGISESELKEAGDIVMGYGIPDDLTVAILEDKDGPLMTKYLSQNPVVMGKLATMPPVQAAIFLEREVRNKAVLLKPKNTDAPNPATRLSGKGVHIDPDSERYPELKGARIE